MVRIIYIVYKNTEIILNYNMNKTIYPRKLYSVSSVNRYAIVSLIFSLKMLSSIRRIGHILNILDQQQLIFLPCLVFLLC